MPWIQLKIDTDNDHAEAISDALMEIGAQAVTLEDRADQPIFEPPLGTTPLWQEVCVVGLFDADVDIQPIIDTLRNQFGDFQWIADPLEDKDWVREWMDSFQPIQFGERLWIVPSWREAPDTNGVNLLLDPGLAFGTGTHPTTALCLKWLDAHAPEGLEVIDYGCGSGILGIAALKLGAKHCIGVDTDPQALLASNNNAAQNGVADKLKLYLPNQGEIKPADLVLANILANPLISLVKHLAALTKPGGQIVLSGILAEQAQEVSNAYAPYFDMQPATQQEDWIRLEGTRK
jgi:ribosomal protein L11 methyltransferase